MAHRKAGGSANNLKDSNAQYLGIKRNNEQKVTTGEIIVRQRGTKYLAGKNVGIGKDHTLFALKDGMVKFTNKNKVSFIGRKKTRKQVSII